MFDGLEVNAILTGSESLEAASTATQIEETVSGLVADRDCGVSNRLNPGISQIR
jgi:hypothetical protein